GADREGACLCGACVPADDQWTPGQADGRWLAGRGAAGAAPVLPPVVAPGGAHAGKRAGGGRTTAGKAANLAWRGGAAHRPHLLRPPGRTAGGGVGGFADPMRPPDTVRRRG